MYIFSLKYFETLSHKDDSVKVLRHKEEPSKIKITDWYSRWKVLGGRNGGCPSQCGGKKKTNKKYQWIQHIHFCNQFAALETEFLEVTRSQKEQEHLFHLRLHFCRWISMSWIQDFHWQWHFLFWASRLNTSEKQTSPYIYHQEWPQINTSIIRNNSNISQWST